MRAPVLPLVVVILASVVAGCASRVSMDAAYEQSLARWKGVSRVELMASWGKPNALQQLPGGDVLIYVVHHDFVNQDQPAGMPAVSVASGGARIVTSGMSTAPRVPVTCTTRFTLEGGVVTAWAFEGIGCGAPQ